MKQFQPTFRTQQLALALVAGAICVRAHAQEVVANIGSAVHVTWATATNRAYQVQVSTNATSGVWTPAGSLIEGTGGVVGAFFDATAPAEFFRVQHTAASGMNWLEGVWQGTTYQASSNSVPFSTRLAITNASRAFTAIFSNSTFGCTAVLDLVAYSDTQATFYARIQSGPCVNGTLVLTRLSPTNTLYNWYYTSDPTAASAFALLRSSP